MEFLIFQSLLEDISNQDGEEKMAGIPWKILLN
ncbi:uncharacterized protein METZ01_LOCUS296177 [marine metagenome]|jgi:hypothetical protein|uniref:Uncharacterized protein n=1 Tax=marine metagenome TaxID=408172 RepID=A0A382M360_9ZZZZ